MQAVILAGGRGTRLKPLTDNIPKPMIKINGRPFLSYLIEQIKKNNILDMVILAGYLGNTIKEYFGDGSEFGVKIAYSFDEDQMGTGGALKRASSFIKGDFLLVNGDTYLNIDYGPVMDKFRVNNKTGLLTVYANEANIAENNVNADLQGFAVGYNKNDRSGMKYLDAGLTVFKKQVMDLIPENTRLSLEEEIFPHLIKERELCVYITGSEFYDMGTLENLNKIKEILK